jgi:hypothetical protein
MELTVIELDGLEDDLAKMNIAKEERIAIAIAKMEQEERIDDRDMEVTAIELDGLEDDLAKMNIAKERIAIAKLNVENEEWIAKMQKEERIAKMQFEKEERFAIENEGVNQNCVALLFI